MNRQINLFLICCLFITGLLFSFPAIGVASFNVLFSDGITTDFEITAGTLWGVKDKAEIIRFSDSRVIHSWSGQPAEVPIYASTWYMPGQEEVTVFYTLRTYQRESILDPWVINNQYTVSVSVNETKGVLHNSTTWLNKLGRKAISWEYLSPNDISDLTIADGEVLIDESTTLTVRHILKVIAPANIVHVGDFHDNRETKNKVFGDGEIQFEGFTANDHLNINNYQFMSSGRLVLHNCSDATIQYNVIGLPAAEKDIYKHQIVVDGNSSKIKIIENQAGRLNIDCDQCEVYQNAADVISIAGNQNRIEENTTTAIDLWGASNTIKKNTVVMQPVLQNGSQHVYYRGISINGPDPAAGNLIEKNTITSEYTFRHNLECLFITCSGNTITDNTIGEKYNLDVYGGGMYVSGSKNIIWQNSIYDAGSFGIKLIYDADQNSIYDNDIAFNYNGIVIIEGDSNLIYANGIDHNTSNGILMFLDTDYSDNISNNVIYYNNILNNDNGIEIKGTGVKNNTIKDNYIGINDLYGIKISSGNIENEIFKNDFMQNLSHANDDGTSNKWFENLWDDYTGVDANNDGYGDIPYDIPGLAGEQDELPLMYNNGSIAVSTDSINFGRSLLTTYDKPDVRKKKNIVITNNGQGDLLIRGISYRGFDRSQFLPMENTCKGRYISPGESCSMDLEYAPYRLGNHIGYLAIMSTDPDQKTFYIELSGQCVLPETGDMNGNTFLDLEDLMIVLKMLAGKKFELNDIACGDMNKDDKLTMVDVLLMLQKLSKP